MYTLSFFFGLKKHFDLYKSDVKVVTQSPKSRRHGRIFMKGNYAMSFMSLVCKQILCIIISLKYDLIHRENYYNVYNYTHTSIKHNHRLKEFT